MPPESTEASFASLTTLEILARLGLAALLGASIGFNADRSRRPAGMRLYATASLLGGLTALLMMSDRKILPEVALPTAMISVAIIVGLISLGLILQQIPTGRPTPGLTAAASLASSAILGVGVGASLWRPSIIAGLMTLLILKGGGFLKGRSRRLENPR